MAARGVSIVIPAYNEESFLPATLAAANEACAHFSASHNFPWEIVVVNNASTDRTEAVALSHGAKVVLHEVRNISSVRNVGIKAASYDLIVMIDADSFLPLDGLVKIWSVMESHQYVGGSLGVKVLTEKVGLKILAPIFQYLVDLTSGIQGAMFFFWRDAAIEIGGFSEDRLVAEDSVFAISLRRYGVKKNQKFLRLRTVIVGTLDRKDSDLRTLLSMVFKAFQGLIGVKQSKEDLKYWYEPKR